MTIKNDKFQFSDPDFQPGEKVEIVFKPFFREFPKADKIGIIQGIKDSGARLIKFYNRETEQYEYTGFARKSSLKKVELVPPELFEID